MISGRHLSPVSRQPGERVAEHFAVQHQLHELRHQRNGTAGYLGKAGS